MANLALKPNAELSKMLRFMTVGLSGTILDFAVLTVLKEVFIFPTLIANTLSFSAGLLNNFTWNRLWTFSDVQRGNLMRQFLQFASISMVGLLLNNWIMLQLEAPLDELLGLDGYGYLPAKVIATGIVFIWNYNANRHWTFKSETGANA